MENKKHIFSNVDFDKYYIVIPENLRNQGWAESFGKIQQELRCISLKIRVVEVDFRKCYWADPLPLLSLFIALNELNESNIRIILPNPKLSNNNRSYGLRRFLSFLFREGFWDIINKFEVVYPLSDSPSASIEFERFSEHYKDIIKNKWATMLSYTDCTILPAKIVDLNTIVSNEVNYISDIEKEIERWLNEIQHRLSSNIASSLEKELRNKIDRFLKETIENVYEHAYPIETRKYSKKIVGCYIRYRKGLANSSLDENSQKELENKINEEHNYCPCLDKSFPKNTSGFFEIFIIDSGIGLSNTFPWAEEEKEHKYPFREIWKRTIEFGERGKNKKNKNTEFGGLYTLSHLCNGSFLAARDCSDWVGDRLPILKQLPSYKLILSLDNSPQVEGLSLIGRIETSTINDKNEKWLKLSNVIKDLTQNPFISAIQESNDIYKKYYKKSSSEIKNLLYIRDERFTYKIKPTIEDCEFCLFLPQDRLPKNKIFSIVNYELGNINIKQRSIIIADIPVWEADIYQYALVNATGYKIIDKVDTIILITKNLSISILTHSEAQDSFSKEKYNTYNYSKDLTKSFLLEMDNMEFSPHRSMKHFVELIRTYDSSQYWTHIQKNNKSNEFFVNNDIVWYQGGREIRLNGYLNFAKTLTDSFCKDIYELELERTLCLENGSLGCNYKSIDLLTNKLALQNNVLFYNSHKENSQSILIGSVYVTGYTARASQVGNSDNKNIVIHFFQNQNIDDSEKTTSPISHLLLWPRDGKDWTGKNLNTNISCNIEYRRIGTSYVIAPYGWKYFPVPRYKLYDKENKCFLNNQPTDTQIKNKERYEFKSVYECSPTETYRYWQGKRGQVLSIGHIDYESNHDIFNIDFPFVVDESFMLGDKLSQFLLSNFLYALGLDENGLSDKMTNQVLRDGIKNDLSKKTNKSNSILILYPFHYNSDYIVSKLKEYIREEYHSKIIALFPVNRERADSIYLISPLTVETLKEEIKKHNSEDVEIMLFDDATIEGKTRKEIKHTLFSLGVKNVRTLTLLERRRLPFSPSEPNYNKAFWRLDIPNLGSIDTCPICNALRKLKELRYSIVTESELNRIQEIEDRWKQTSPYENNNKQLLPSIPITTGDVIRKKFGIIINTENGSILCGNHDDNIEITNSLGLSIYVSELHAMTSRDDIIFDFLKEQEEGKPIINDCAKIEMLSTFLLLYKKDISNLTLEQIIKKLFILCKDKEENNYTSYALISLLNVSSEKLNLLYEICKEEVGTDIAVQNKDMILLCFILSLDNVSNFSKAKSLKKYRKKNLKDIYSLFHSEIFNDNGIIHTVPLHLIAKQDASDSDFSKAIDSCKKIHYSIEEGIPSWLFRGNISEPQIKEIIEQINNLKERIEKNNGENTKLPELAQELLSKLENIHNKLFACVGAREEESSLKTLIKELIKENALFDIEISSDFKKLELQNFQIERWIIWDSYVCTELKYLLNNAIKAGIDVEDPFLTESQHINKKVWVSVQYDDNNKRLFLLIYNKSDSTVAEVKEKTNKKMRYGKNHLSEIGIEVDYQSVIIENGKEQTLNDDIQDKDYKNKYLKTIILFPYI